MRSTVAAMARSVLGRNHYRAVSMKSDMLNATIALLDMKSVEEFPAIAKEVGVSYNWLKFVYDRKIANPGVLKLETLYRFLSDKSVEF